MKKKIIIVAVMVFVCTGLFMLTQKVQNSYFNNKVSAAGEVQSKKAGITSTNTATDIAKQSVAPNKTIVKSVEVPKVAPKVVTPAVVTVAPKAVVTQPADKGPFNFTIIDAVNNKVIIEKNIDFNGKTVDYITCKLLNEAGIKYINEGEGGSTSYFNSIAGLTERNGGALRGWCFYVNGEKPGIGAGSYIYHKGDKVQWKYLNDALNN